MGAASRYWRLARIDAAGGGKTELVEPAKAFFWQQFPELEGEADIADVPVQRQLLALVRCKDANVSEMARLCLRCFISNQIKQVCLQLAAQFGAAHGFTAGDLFPFVLDDVNGEVSPTYRSLASEILQAFDPERGSLGTWTNKLVKSHRELNIFLLQQGVYLVSDWAILNDTSLKQLQRIFAEFHDLTAVEIRQYSALLETYHAVYRADRLLQRQGGMKGHCLPPTANQLQAIARQFLQTTTLNLSPERILNRLQDMAALLREYRLYVKGGTPPVKSLDDPHTLQQVENWQSADWRSELENTDERTEFLQVYRQQVIICLDRAVEEVTGDRVSKLQRKKPQEAEKFIAALRLFHCQGRSMSEIAGAVGLQAQYQVTRLLKLKEFRADIRQRMLEFLRGFILEKAAAYADPDRLQTLDREVEAVLDEQIAAVIKEAAAEASVPRNRPAKSLFARRLCQYLRRLLSHRLKKRED